ncbi:hypothetical protein CERSUDRAFT_52082 [Gelatoporia subvermispora B]|uniref:thioredoxin-dependent peroxiredoxin n=1 Tax=Ceriporiopsis subvermispora (strain B) TaxID=914234 RepID=M2RCY3_CERS8|nr:hypothetical protein CERSUDRAFT_52082 [Gelatoporia subvermispora B]
MAPRKPAAEPTAPTRRSSRISAQPKEELVKEKPEKKAPKKRNADETAGAGDAPKPKKVHSGFSSASNPELTFPPELPNIDVGDTLPSVVLKNEQGEDVDVATLTAEKGIIVFLVPKADTPGCTNQACGFRDSYPDFTSVGFDVYCLSADSPTAQNKWKTKKELPYPLISDPKRVLIRALGAGEGGKTQRSHFIFEKGGKLIDKRIPVKPVDSPKDALAFVKGLGDASS